MKPFILILTFLTRIPIPMNFEFNPKDFVKGTKLFPVIGIIIGGLVAPIFLIVDYVPVNLFPFIVIVWYLLIVGGIHVDGVADLFDGIFSARKRDRILEIMTDSRVGTFGVIGIMLYFFGMYFSLTEVYFMENNWIVLFCFPIIGRISGIYASGISHYAKEEGLGKAIIDNTKPMHSLLYALVVIVISFFLGLEYLIAVVVTLLLITIIVLRINKILDGITGDVVGAMVEIAQVIYLVVLAICVYN